MTIINRETFEYYKKRKNLTNKAIADTAGVDERTVGKIKKNGDLNSSTVERIAAAMDKSVEDLLSPVIKENEAMPRNWKSDQEFVALHYGVSPSWIAKNAHLFFAHVAEDFFHHRMEELKRNKTSLKDFCHNLTNGKTDEIESKNESEFDIYVKSGLYDLKEHLDIEHVNIIDKRLDGPKIFKNQNNMFVDWFLNNSRSFEYDDGYKENNNHSVEDIGDEIFLLANGISEGLDKLIEPPEDYSGPKEYTEFYGDDTPVGWWEARRLFQDNPYTLLPSEIPVSLRKPENYEKKLSWIISEIQKRVSKTKENIDA